jgi:hypothetical protein
MGHGANILFNLIAILFLMLTVAVGVIVIGVATDSMEPPILAPEDTAIPPTAIEVIPTITPSPGPGGEIVTEAAPAQ